MRLTHAIKKLLFPRKPRRLFLPTVPVMIAYAPFALPTKCLVEGEVPYQVVLKRYVEKDGHSHIIPEDYPDYRETNPHK